MNDITTGEGLPKRRWQRIVDFPLVAMLIAIALFALALQTGVWLGQMVPATDQLTSEAIRAAINVTLVLVTYKMVIAHLGQDPRDDLRPRNALRDLGLGLGAGLLLFSLIVGIAAAFDVYNIVGYGGTGELLMDLITVALLPGFMEELVFRGILFRWIEELAGSWVALLITSALFGLAHIFNPGATWFSSFTIAVEAGVLLGGSYMLTRSLWMPMGLHAAWNFTQGFIFDVPVSGMDQHGLVEAKLSGPALLSGGGFGLEASVIGLVVAGAAGAWLVRLSIKRGRLVPPWWVRRREAVSAT
jgi:membrane protease YdiL (CAAX protease family)